mmetsp:Transcript_79437/g.199633  ORF Transcript_79437/g.199633 Transcript_79437/m.199633 type:complete len:204 (+) Transcript_79437:325-936(+)
MKSSVADRLENVVSELGVACNLFLFLCSVQVVLQADPARLQVPLRSGGNAQVTHREALCILCPHSICILNRVLVVDSRMLCQAHGLKDNAQVCVGNQAASAIRQFQVLIVELDGLVVLAQLECVDAQAVVRQGLALGVLGGYAQRQELLVLLDSFLEHALVVVHNTHSVVSLQGLIDVARTARRVCQQLEIRNLLPIIRRPRP